MKKPLFLLLMAMMLQNASAQLKTYVTLEAGPQWSLIQVADPNDLFERASVRSSMAGFTLGQEIIPNLSIVTGVYYVANRNGINMIDKRPHQSGWSSYNSLLVPLRVEYRIQPTEFPLVLHPDWAICLDWFNRGTPTRHQESFQHPMVQLTAMTWPRPIPLRTFICWR